MTSKNLGWLLGISLLIGCMLYMGIGTIGWLMRMISQGMLIGVVIFVVAGICLFFRRK